MKYDIIIVGAGPGGIFSAYELTKEDKGLKVAVFESGHPLEKRHCPIDGERVKNCVGCKSCSIMSGFGGAGAFSDGKYNITNDFGGTLYEYIGKQPAIDLMKYVDAINMEYGGEGTKMYSTAGSQFKKTCLQNKLKLLDASVRHLGTDVNFVVLENLYARLKERVDFFRKKWQKEHMLSLVVGVIFLVVLVIVGYFTRLYVLSTVVVPILLVVFTVVRYNMMMAYVERNAYDGKGKK